MTIKTCSKESGQRLVELGVTKESYFYWTDFGEGDGVELYSIDRFEPDAEDTPAFTACELGEVLQKVQPHKVIEAVDALYNYEGRLTERMGWIQFILIKLLADPDLLCKVLIWLLENGHITKETEG